jgi:hypothetical protein
VIPSVLLALSIALVIAAGLDSLANLELETRGRLALGSLASGLLSIVVRFV